uniref:Uncharacterized protein n=1 Tax=Aegilops tauschii subsp. strangulata TaxID=200361 RepID=A0A453D968_AEGTS
MLPETREQLPFILQMMLFCVHTISTSVAVYHQYLQVRNLHLNPILFDRYVLKSEKADVYRLPYLSSGAPGFGLSLLAVCWFYYVHFLLSLGMKRNLNYQTRESSFANKRNTSFTWDTTHYLTCFGNFK